MATHAHSTTAPARRLLPPAAGRATPARDARGRFVRRYELPPEPLLAMADAAESTTPAARGVTGLNPEPAPEGTTFPQPSEPPPPSADEVLGDIARELDRQGVPRGASPCAPVVRLRLVGASSPGRAAAAAPSCTHLPDPAFAAVRAFDAAVLEWDGAFAEYVGIMDALDPDGCADWNDPLTVAREALGPLAGSTVAALDGLLGRLGPAGDRLLEAEDEIFATRAATELGAAALRAAVRRYARRPFGCPGDEDVMLAKLAA